MQNRPKEAEWSAKGIIQTGDYGHLSWEVSVEVMKSDSILGMFLRADRLSSAGTFHPSSEISSPFFSFLMAQEAGPYRLH